MRLLEILITYWFVWAPLETVTESRGANPKNVNMKKKWTTRNWVLPREPFWQLFTVTNLTWRIWKWFSNNSVGISWQGLNRWRSVMTSEAELSNPQNLKDLQFYFFGIWQAVEHTCKWCYCTSKNHPVRNNLSILYKITTDLVKTRYYGIFYPAR